jgi:Zn-dependent metalloprotease
MNGAIPVRLGIRTSDGQPITYAADPTVLAHEIGHALHVRMSGYRPGFTGRGGAGDLQMAAVGEYIADGFASLVTDQGWRMGPVIGTPAGGGARRIRILTDAAQSPLIVERTADGPLVAEVPTSMDGYLTWRSTAGGPVHHPPHANAHIPGTATRHILESIGDVQFEDLYIATLQQPARHHLGFQGLADSMLAASSELRSNRDGAASAVRDGWAAVGIIPRMP